MLARVQLIFYSFPAHLIVRWCGVSPATASLWKLDKRRPSLCGPS
jgi:hypothetical protein